MIVWAFVQDVRDADLEGVASGFHDAQIQYWLDRAERLIAGSVKGLDDRLAAGVVTLDAPSDVQIDLVLGKLGNPRAIRTIQESNGPTSGSVTFGGDSPGALVLTDEHWRSLGGRPRLPRAARTVPTW